jgi:hypothetical protein
LTYCILEEDHTLGNLLRYMLMKKCVLVHSFLELMKLTLSSPLLPARRSSSAVTRTLAVCPSPFPQADRRFPSSVHHIPRKRRFTFASRCMVRSLPFPLFLLPAYRSPSPDGKSAQTAFEEALDNIESAAEVVLEKYHASLQAGDYERVEDPAHDFESVNRKLWEQKEAQGKGTYEEFLEEKRRKEEKEGEGKGKKTIKGGR